MNLLWLLLILPLGALIFFAIRWKRITRAKLGDQTLVSSLIASYSPQKFLLKSLLSLVAIILLVLALVNFRKPDSSEKIKLSGTDLMIALDVSNSMMAKDIQPTRLEKAKLLISKLIDQLGGNRVGMVVFAGNAYLQMPLTTDASAAKLFLSTITPDLVPLQGTNISDALKLCNKSLNINEKKYKSILLISDGEDHDDATIATVKELKEKGVVINTVGVGSPNGSPIVDPITNDVKRDDQGNVVISKLNEKELEDIAAQANGNYELLTEADHTAKNIIAQLQNMDKKPIADSTLTNYYSYFWMFVAVAILLLVIELLISEKKRSSKILNDTNKPASSGMNSVKIVFFLLFILFNSYFSFGQKERELVRKGNDAYKQQKFDEAVKQYEEALKQKNNDNAATFNLGNAKFKNGKYEEAAKQYDALNTSDKQLLAKSLYNKGVSLVKQQKLKEAIDAFKQSLRASSTDEDTRENLQKALNELQKQQQQQNQKDKENKKDEQQNKENKEEKEKEDKKEGDKKQEAQPKNDPKDQEKKESDNQPQPNKAKMSKEEAEQKLQALRQEEKKLQQRLNQKQKANVKQQPEKDW